MGVNYIQICAEDIIVIHRRNFVAEIVTALACGCHVQARDHISIGCILTASAAGSLNEKALNISRKSSDANFDYALAQTLGMLSDTFGVIPGFGYYDDIPENAFATTLRFFGHPDGSILMGRNLLKKLLTSFESPSVAVATICAHEFGHILQFKLNLQSKILQGQSTVKRSELQADYFAGYFTGLRKQRRPSYPAASAALTQHEGGDNLFYNPSHHGTPAERGNAVVKGFLASSRYDKTLMEAVKDSTLYVMSF